MAVSSSAHFVSGLDMTCIALRCERTLALYRQYKASPFRLTRHYKKEFLRLGFMSLRNKSENASRAVLVSNETKVLKRLVDQRRLRRSQFSITQKSWIHASSFNYQLLDNGTQYKDPAFSWAVVLSGLLPYSVSQRKLACVLGFTREHINQKISLLSRKSKLFTWTRTFLSSNKPVHRRPWFEFGGRYYRPWNNHYKSPLPLIPLGKTFFFESRALWASFRDTEPRDASPRRSRNSSGRTQKSPQLMPHPPAYWRVVAERTIHRTKKVRLWVPDARKRPIHKTRFLSSNKLHELVYKTRDVEARGRVFKSTRIECLPPRLKLECGSNPFVGITLYKGSIKQIASRRRTFASGFCGGRRWAGRLCVRKSYTSYR